MPAPLVPEGRSGRAGPGVLRRRRNGVSKTAAKPHANTIVSGSTRASETRKNGTPSGTRPATIRSHTIATIGAWVRYRL